MASQLGAGDDVRDPADFYRMSPAEMQLLSQQQRDEAAKLRTLRTHAMRAAERDARRKNYTVATIRLRLPDGNVLQGASRASHSAAMKRSRALLLAFAF